MRSLIRTKHATPGKSVMKSLLAIIAAAIPLRYGSRKGKRSKAVEARYTRRKPVATRDKPSATGHRTRRRHGFMRLALKHIEMVRSIRSTSTIQNYMTALRSFQAFTDAERPCCDASIDAMTIERYDRWLCMKGIKPNTRSCYLRSLRALYRATDTRSGHGEDPFSNVFTGNAVTEKRAIDVDALHRIRRLEFTHDEHELRMARDIFLFCTFAMGMPFVDAYTLTHEQVRDGVLSYARHKTGQMVRVRIEPCMSEIMARYRHDGSHRIFPLCADYASALRKYNTLLRLIADRAHISQHLTSYVARHTWATVAYREHIDLSLISQGMGHANTRATSIYIKKADDKKLWRANRRVLQVMNKPTSAQEVGCMYFPTAKLI